MYKKAIIGPRIRYRPQYRWSQSDLGRLQDALATYLNIDQSIVFPTTNIVFKMNGVPLLTVTIRILSLTNVFRCCWLVWKRMHSVDKNDREFEMKDDFNSNNRLISCCYLWKMSKTVKNGRRDDSGIRDILWLEKEHFFSRDVVVDISRTAMFEPKQTTDWKIIYISTTIITAPWNNRSNRTSFRGCLSTE